MDASVSTPPEMNRAAFSALQWTSWSLSMVPIPSVPRPRMTPAPATFFAAFLLDARRSACSNTKGSDFVSSARRIESSTKIGAGDRRGTQAHSAALAVGAGAAFSILSPAGLGDAAGVLAADTGGVGGSWASARDAARPAVRSTTSMDCATGRRLKHPNLFRAAVDIFSPGRIVARPLEPHKTVVWRTERRGVGNDRRSPLRTCRQNAQLRSRRDTHQLHRLAEA